MLYVRLKMDTLVIIAILALSSIPKNPWIRISSAIVALILTIFATMLADGMKKANSDSMVNSFRTIRQWLDNGEDERVLHSISELSKYYTQRGSFSAMSFEKCLIGIDTEYMNNNKKKKGDSVVDDHPEDDKIRHIEQAAATNP